MTRPGKATKRSKQKLSPSLFLLAGEGGVSVSLVLARRGHSGSPLLHHSPCAGEKLLFPMPTCLGVQKDKSKRCVLQYPGVQTLLYREPTPPRASDGESSFEF